MAEQRIIIVGGGVAGLVAARNLAREGRRVELLEARDRLGGRIQTERDPGWPMPIELGAEFVHGQPEPTLRLLNEARLSLQALEDRHHVALPASEARGALAVRELPRFAARTRQLLADVRLGEPDCSAAEFAQRAGLAGEERVLFELFVEGFHAVPLEDVSMQSLARDARARGTSEGGLFRVQEGYGALVEWLAQQVAAESSARIHLQSVVRSVIWEKGQASVAVEQGDRSWQFSGDALLVTVPLGVLAAPRGLGIDFYPLLTAQRSAIDLCAMTRVLKLVLRFREAFWERAGQPDWEFLHDPEAAFPTFWRQAQGRAQQITAWVGGPRARLAAVRWEPAAVREAVATLCRLLRASTQCALEALIGFHGSALEHDPFARGAYGYARPGGQHVHELLAASIQNTLFFAGEATDVEHPATVAGAIQSAERAAREILEARQGGRS